MPSKRNKTIRKRVFAALIVFFILFAGLWIIKVAEFVPVFFQLMTGKGVSLKETKENNVNILLMGVGGGNHEGPDLTDTIIFVNLDPESKKATLISIPRDLWVPELKAKVNTAYHYGEAKQKGGGLLLAKAVVGNLLDQQIDYAIKIDFDGFIKAVDMVGGLDINVERTLDDYQYPLVDQEDEACGKTEEEIEDLTAQIATGSATGFEAFPCRYEHVHFDKGLIHMDGASALKFVRSRHAEGEEGSDFARSKRQEKVISALKDKVFSLGMLLNPIRAANLIDVVKGSIDTDIKQDEYDDFIRLVDKMKPLKIDSVVVDTGSIADERFGLLVDELPSREYGGQYVLAPRQGDFSEIHEYIACMLETGLCEVGANSIITPTPKPTTGIKKR